MAEEAVGIIVMSVNGQEYDCASCTPKTETGKKPVKTMNRTGKVKFKSNGIKTFTLDVSVVIPDGKDSLDWGNIEDARISIESVTGNYRKTYIDCTTQTVSDAYSVEGETRRDLTMFALDELDESAV